MKSINSILIANRGEIALRIIRTCKKMGIQSIVVYSEADAQMPFVKAADQAVALKGKQASETYLDINAIIAAAKRTAADAIHPGYGFLSEQADFARRLEAEGLIWIGPKPEAIEQMGLKAQAKAIAKAQQVPIIPGYNGQAQDLESLKKEALQIGFPLLIKASAGGGGKGMRIVSEEKQLQAAIEGAQREAEKSFGDGTLLIERYFPSARHIEVQVLGDQHGKVLHLFERECSLQRRYQKVIEESPSPVLSDKKREEICAAALRLCQGIGYDNAGTVEFIYTPEGEFYFLEVNTRLQVEHPVTEAITGLDLVEWQIRVAAGEALPFEQTDIQAKGYALQCRLYAENPANNFLPVTGKIYDWHTEELEGLRYDTGLETGSEVSMFYDPMLAKVIAYGENRSMTIRRMRRALSLLRAQGLVTNQQFLRDLIALPSFEAGEYDTQFIERKMELEATVPTHILQETALALLAWQWHQRQEKRKLLKSIPTGFRNNFYQMQQQSFLHGELQLDFAYSNNAEHLEVVYEEENYQLQIIQIEAGMIQLSINGLAKTYHIAEANEGQFFVQHPHYTSLEIKEKDRYPSTKTEEAEGSYKSPMPGEILKVLVKENDQVKEGDALLILVSMKMENTIYAHADGQIKAVFVEAGEQIEAGTQLLEFEER
jgi:acetyl/propionyl-CoA carboxylase alpha subunit